MSVIYLFLTMIGLITFYLLFSIYFQLFLNKGVDVCHTEMLKKNSDNFLACK